MIATTHVGSLPRGPELVPLLLARDKGEAYDAAEFDRVVQAAVDEAVRLQVASGVSVVSDGELGKVGYSTYIIERSEERRVGKECRCRWSLDHLEHRTCRP